MDKFGSKKIILFVLLGVLIIISVPIIFKFGTNHNNLLASITNIISAISTVITLIIALLLFDKFGLKKTQIEKQYESVLSILNVLKKIRLIIIYKKESSKVLFHYIADSNNHNSELEILYNRKVYFNGAYLNALNEFYQISRNINFPNSIRKEIRILEPNCIVVKSNINRDESVFIRTKSVNVEHDTDYGNLSGKELTFFEFYNYWNKIYEKLLNWLKEHNYDISEINIL